MPKKKKAAHNLTQLPSGSWNSRVYDYTDENGKDHFRSFTNKDPNQVILAVAQFKADKKSRAEEANARPAHILLSDAMDRVMESKRNLISPSTYRSYRAIRNNNLQGLMRCYVDEITQEQIQVAINNEALSHAPKTVFNMHGFLVSVITTFRPDFVPRTTLPQKVKPSIAIPTEDEIKTLLAAARDTDMELPIILAAICGMRRSEIAALTFESIDLEKRTISISRAVVRGVDTTWVEKTTKTETSTRTIRMFPQAYDAILRVSAMRSPSEPLVTLSPNKITERFSSLLKACGLPSYRFHDLRHFCVSAMIGQGVPKKYVSSYVGHSSENMVDRVYFHTMASVKTETEDIMESYYSKIF